MDIIELLKALLLGIVEGITEWLPISSTGHMILVEQLIQFEASDAFLSMFRVVIQLGAIMAVVVLFWGKLWPFGLRHGRVISKAPVWSLWFKVVVATLPVFLNALTELTTSSLLWSAGSETLGVVIYNYTSAGYTTSACALSTVVCITILLLVLLYKGVSALLRRRIGEE